VLGLRAPWTWKEFSCLSLHSEGLLVRPASHLSQAKIQALGLPGTRLPALRAEQLQADGSIVLNQGFTASEILLPGAYIQGQLNLQGATITNPKRQRPVC
jgi:hypothetical protein